MMGKIATMVREHTCEGMRERRSITQCGGGWREFKSIAGGKQKVGDIDFCPYCGDELPEWEDVVEEVPAGQLAEAMERLEREFACAKNAGNAIGTRVWRMDHHLWCSFRQAAMNAICAWDGWESQRADPTRDALTEAAQEIYRLRSTVGNTSDEELAARLALDDATEGYNKAHKEGT